VLHGSPTPGEYWVFAGGAIIVSVSFADDVRRPHADHRAVVGLERARFEVDARAIDEAVEAHRFLRRSRAGAGRGGDDRHGDGEKAEQLHRIPAGSFTVTAT